MQLARGGSGNDEIYGAEESEDVYGGPGDDLIGHRFEGNDSIEAVENLYSGVSGRDDVVIGDDSGWDDILRGDAGANSLEGTLGKDTIEGRAGDDFLDGGTGSPFFGGKENDVLDGGEGNDTCVNGERVSDCEMNP